MYPVCTTWEGKKKLIAGSDLLPRSSAYSVIKENNKVLLVKNKSMINFGFQVEL